MAVSSLMKLKRLTQTLPVCKQAASKQASNSIEISMLFGCNFSLCLPALLLFSSASFPQVPWKSSIVSLGTDASNLFHTLFCMRAFWADDASFPLPFLLDLKP
jgi:hypothetical protein